MSNIMKVTYAAFGMLLFLGGFQQHISAEVWKDQNGVILADGEIGKLGDDTVTIRLTDGDFRVFPLGQLGREELLRICRFILQQAPQAEKEPEPVVQEPEDAGAKPAVRRRQNTKRKPEDPTLESLVEKVFEGDGNDMGDFALVVDQAELHRRMREAIHGKRAMIKVQVRDVRVHPVWNMPVVYGAWLIDTDKLQRLGFTNFDGAQFPLRLSRTEAKSLRRGDVIRVNGRAGIFFGRADQMRPRFGVVTFTVTENPSALVIETQSQAVDEKFGGDGFDR